MNTITISGMRATVDAGTAGTVRFAMRRFAGLTAARRLAVVASATDYFAAVANGGNSDRFLGQFEGLMGFRGREEVQMSWSMDALLGWFEDGYSFSSDGSQRN